MNQRTTLEIIAPTVEEAIALAGANDGTTPQAPTSTPAERAPTLASRATNPPPTEVPVCSINVHA